MPTNPNRPKFVTKKLASELGLKSYFTGVPCPKNHVCERWTINSSCVECGKERCRKYRLDNYKHLILVEKIYRDTHAESFGNKFRKWQIRNRGRRNAYEILRRTRKILATPTWVDVEQLNNIYINCPKGMQVDHIIPLKSKVVCGLHVPWNLQYLTASENASKGNRFDGLE